VSIAMRVSSNARPVHFRFQNPVKRTRSIRLREAFERRLFCSGDGLGEGLRFGIDRRALRLHHAWIFPLRVQPEYTGRGYHAKAGDYS